METLEYKKRFCYLSDKVCLTLRKHILSGIGPRHFLLETVVTVLKIPINKLSLIYIEMKQTNKIINFLIENR